MVQETDINLKNFKIEVFYQKILNNRGKTFAYEALARFSVNDNYLNTEKTIKYLDSINQLHIIGMKLFDIIVEDIKKYSLPYVFMNVSASQLEDVEFINYIVSKLKEQNLTNRFGLEVNEESINFGKINQSIVLIKESNILLLIDDFGSNSASIERLFWPIDIIKIDKKYLSEPYSSILKYMVEMIKTVGKKIVIEGIETKSHVDLIKPLGIDFFQGYLIDRPKKLMM